MARVPDDIRDAAPSDAPESRDLENSAEAQARAAFDKRRRARSIALAVALAALVILFYVVTITKMGPQILDRPL